MTKRVAFVNGAVVPEDQAVISIRDRGFVYGDSVFDTARTFNGVAFRLQEHIDRLFETLRYVRIDPGYSKAELLQATEQLIEANRPALAKGTDYWVSIRVSAGLQTLDGEPPQHEGATVVIECTPLPLRARAGFFRDGVDMVVPARRRIAPSALSPNAKTNNYLNMMLAQREVNAVQPNAWALMCDENGNLAEGAGCNLFVVKKGVVYTPTTEYVLAGISRQIAIDLCHNLGIELVERDVSMQLAMTADEAFLTSTSLCVCPVRGINGDVMPAEIPGPTTKRIMTAFSELVGMDYVEQYLRFLSNTQGGTGF